MASSRILLQSKIHRAVVTDGHVDYEGSLAIDRDLMDAVGIVPYEKILVGNQANGERFETYAIEAPRGSASIILNGATAHLGKKGDRLTIMTFGVIAENLVEDHRPRVIVLNDDNQIIRTK